MENIIQTEQDLQQLIGQYESIRLDFKASALLAQPSEQIVKQLTEDVSGFANTEGGVIVIAIREGKSGKKSIATEIDEGVDPTDMSPERLEQLIASNISPAIQGLTVRSISLSGAKAGRAAYVVTVPRGNTAYQARHSWRYYGRREFAAYPLDDSHIRLLMARGRVPQARVDASRCGVVTADQELAVRQSKLQEISARREAGEVLIHGHGVPKREYLEAPKRDYDQYEFQLAIANAGEVTLRDFLLRLVFATDFRLYTPLNQALSPGESLQEVASGKELRYRFAHGEVTTVSPGWRNYLPPERKLFPGDRIKFPEHPWFIHVPAGAHIPRRTVRLSWTIYLDDASPSTGEIDITDLF